MLRRNNLCIGALALSGTAIAQSPTDMPPNLSPLPAFDISLTTNLNGESTLRFGTTTANLGLGPLQLVGGDIDTGSAKQRVDQEVFLSDGSSFRHNAGVFEYHAAHSHIHFENFALYELQPVNAPGGSLLAGSKVTFCVMDTDLIDSRLPGAPSSPVYTTCNSQIQGLSVGWADTYGAHLPGQEIDVTDAPDGIYKLRIVSDPKNTLIETDETDNESCVLVQIARPNSVNVLDSSGRCAGVTSISPNSAAMGASVVVSISGFGFTENASVQFERGNGPRPVASNIQLVSDTDTIDIITATITVPRKRKGGKDPVWNLVVGDSTLFDAFTVTQ
jgi:hypothetical protein